MRTWEYLQIHVESSKGGMLASVYGKDAADKKDFRDLADLMGYLNSLGAEGWEMVNADRNEYGFQNYFFKRLIEGKSQGDKWRRSEIQRQQSESARTK